MLQLSGVRRENNGDKDKMTQIKNISEVTEPLKEQILKGDVHTIDEMRAWLKPLGYSDTINEAAINFILREFVMSKVPSGSLSNVEMIVESLRPQLEVTTKDIEPIIIMGLYHHRNLIGSPSAFSLALSK
jgi:DNA helicase TIP49 (TBP-interacting protein)